ncbi:ABC transporter substrate-binding protein [Rhodococcus sp. BS-15]|uniref:ABC transporter substrate-binding protein n=1 Tax=Rhodococcus sp. BS-15 TaxID=1304954 RepID=UPI001F294FA5|nr:ABC transporter substrate-binding protein [Rhodococcus sp. BS-15]
MKKSVQLVAAGASVLALAAGCSSDTDASGSPGSSAGFPVTIDHRFGETVIDTEPTRVVTIGFNEQDFALALGVKPVATRGNLSYDYRQRPWAQAALGGTEIPEVGSTDLDLEQIAAQAPDLILGPYSFIDQGQYDTLSGMAPTIADIGGYDDVPAATWQREFAVVGEASASRRKLRTRRPSSSRSSPTPKREPPVHRQVTDSRVRHGRRQLPASRQGRHPRPVLHRPRLRNSRRLRDHQ